MERQPQAVGLENVVNISASAEHGVITLSEPNKSVQVGDVLDFIVGYGDATVFLHDAMYGVRNGIVETVWADQRAREVAVMELYLRPTIVGPNLSSVYARTSMRDSSWEHIPGRIQVQSRAEILQITRHVQQEMVEEDVSA